MRKIVLSGIGVCLLVVGVALHYALPRVSVVEVIGVEVKRIDEGNQTRDVYMIQTQKPGGGAVRVFRNEDAWYYLKLNSANLQAEATAFAREEDGGMMVAIRHYGWRIPIFSMFQNAIDVWPVEPGYRHIPLFNMTVIALLIAGAVLAWLRIRRMIGRFAEVRTERAEKRARERRPAKATAAKAESDQEKWLLQDQRAPGPSDSSERGE